MNTSQHKSTRVNTNQHKSDTSQHVSDTSQHESTWVYTSQLDQEIIIIYHSFSW